jgi:hypothetical protein
LFAKGLSRLAELALVDAEIEDYSRHNLVADLLLEHHLEFLATKTSLCHFIETYRKVNDSFEMRW